MHKELSNLILKEYAKILETGELFDTEILVGEEPNTKIFRLHSFVLKAQSPYFRTALSNDWVKAEDNIIKFNKPNISVKVFEILINYIYSGKIKLNNGVKTNVELLTAADELCLNELCLYIEEYLLKDKELLKRNFVLIQNVTNKFTHYTKLSQFYQITYQQDLSLIFKADDFTTIKQEVLLELLIHKDDSLTQIEVWDKLMDWAIANSDELPHDIKKWADDNISTFGNLVQPFIPHINFQEIAYTDFLQKIKPYKNIFDDKLYIQMIEFYCFNNNVYTNLNLVDYIDSRIVNLNDASLIANWIKMMKQGRKIIFNLLIRGSRDGFGRRIFHIYCDNKGPTVTIARVKNSNEILGGFNPCDWDSREVDLNSDYNYDSTKDSFIFFLDQNNLEGSIFSKVVDTKHAIYNNTNHGPCFGGGEFSDFELFNKKKHGLCIKASYEKAIRRSEEHFEVDEYEVFQVISNNKSL